jgi:hypothetical protein
MGGETPKNIRKVRIAICILVADHSLNR